jgi:hypothetical protein
LGPGLLSFVLLLASNTASPGASNNGFDAVKDRPCTNQEQGLAIVETLQMFPMTAEGYGVVRNVFAPRPGMFLEDSLREGWAYRRHDDWHGAQQLIVELAPRNESSGVYATSEMLFTSSIMLDSLLKMIVQMHDGRDSDRKSVPFPYTAFLALADRIDSDATPEESPCLLAADAAHLMHVLDGAASRAEPNLETPEKCRASMATFHAWLVTHRRELQAGADAERKQIAEARTIMGRIRLCRY